MMIRTALCWLISKSQFFLIERSVRSCYISHPWLLSDYGQTLLDGHKRVNQIPSNGDKATYVDGTGTEKDQAWSLVLSSL